MTRRIPFLAGCLLLLTAAPLYADDAEDKAVEAVKKLGAGSPATRRPTASRSSPWTSPAPM